MHIGKQWVFVSQTDTLIETIVDTKRIGENLYFSFDQFRGSSGYLSRMVENQVFIYVDTAEYLWYDFTADSGDSWMAPAGPILPFHQTTFYLLSKTDTVVTPIGTFTNCYLFDHFIGYDYDILEWFAPGIGIVQRSIWGWGITTWILTDTTIMTSVNDRKKLDIPKTFILSQNHPNPFNPSTIISYSIPKSDFVMLKIYDILGREIQTLVSEFKEPGIYSINFSASSLPSGVYLYRLQAGNLVETRKMLLIR